MPTTINPIHRLIIHLLVASATVTSFSQPPGSPDPSYPTKQDCGRLEERASSDENAKFTFKESETLRVCRGSKVVSLPRFLSFREVKDNFGRRIANEYAVVQVTVRNESKSQQFFLQDITVAFDPTACSALAEGYGFQSGNSDYTRLMTSSYNETTYSKADENESQPKSRFDLAEMAIGNCFREYANYLKYPIPFKSADRRTVLAVGTIGQKKSPRNVLLNAIQFTASVGSAMTGLGFIGTDGKTALGILGGSFIDSTRASLPDFSTGQLTNLTEATYAANNLIDPKRSEPFFMFVPRDKIFAKTTWDMYKRDRKKKQENALELRRIIELSLTSTASGILIESERNKEVVSAPGNALKELNKARGTQ